MGPSRGCSAQTGRPALIFAGKTDLLFQASVFSSVSGDNYTSHHRPVVRINYLKLLAQPVGRRPAQGPGGRESGDGGGLSGHQPGLGIPELVTESSAMLRGPSNPLSMLAHLLHSHAQWKLRDYHTPEPQPFTHTHACTHARTQTYVHTLAHARTHTDTHVHRCAHMHIRTRTHMHAHVCTRMHTCAHTLSHTDTHAHKHACTDAHTCTDAHAHTHMHTHTHTHKTWARTRTT